MEILEQSFFWKLFDPMMVCFYWEAIFLLLIDLISLIILLQSKIKSFSIYTFNLISLYKNANARTSHCMHSYAGLAELIISQRFINSASVKSAIDRYTNYYTHE